MSQVGPAKGGQVADATTKEATIKGLQADYVPTYWTGRNESGLRVHSKNILVHVDAAAATTAGGVMITEERLENMTNASETGCLVDMGPDAFRYHDDGTPWRGLTPKIGERVYFERYAGVLMRGVDGQVYRAMDFRTISATLDLENPRVKEFMANDPNYQAAQRIAAAHAQPQLQHHGEGEQP